MSRRANLLNYLITTVLTMIALLLVLNIGLTRYGGKMTDILIKFTVACVTAGLFNAIVHELGHLIAGKSNKFVFSSMVIWFFKWARVNKKIQFSFVMLGDEAGYTEMIPQSEENIEKRFVNMTRGGLIGSIIVTILSIPSLFINTLSLWGFVLWSSLLPIGIYYVFGTLLPLSTGGVLNDGGILYHFKKGTDNSKVMANLLKIQANLYNGKTPSEIDEKLYFDIPQLPEDNLNFALILNARYNYYLDKKDYENAKKTTDRLLSLEDYLPKLYLWVFKTDALYNACTFDFNEELADDLMYELEKYLNNINTATNVRVKLAYLTNVTGEKEGLDIFIKKAQKEAKRCQIKGLGIYETKLLTDLVENMVANSKN